MHGLTVFLHVVLIILFATSGLDKLRHADDFARVIHAYAILPDWMNEPVVRVIPVLELLGSLLLCITRFHIVGLCVVIGLSCCFSIAMLINLLRGRNELDCGCGGMFGSERISWWMVVRNLALISAMVAAWQSADFSVSDVPLTSLTLVVTILAATALRTLVVRRDLRELIRVRQRAMTQPQTFQMDGEKLWR